MLLSRLFIPLLFVFSLLFVQQMGVEHALFHSLEEQNQQDKQAPHFPVCGQCVAYAQLGSALNSPFHSFAVLATSAASVQHRSVSFHSISVFAATARGPPALQRIA